MKGEQLEIAPEDPYGPEEPFHPMDPGDYPPDKPEDNRPDPVVPPIEPDPEPQPDIDPDEIIPPDDEDDGETESHNKNYRLYNIKTR